MKILGEKFTVHFFLVQTHDDKEGTYVEILEPQFQEASMRKKAVKKIKWKKLGMKMKDNMELEETYTNYDRLVEDEAAPYKAVVPRKVFKKLFDFHLNIDWARRAFESLDGQCLIMFSLAGREIIVASLLPKEKRSKKTKFDNIQ